MTRFCSAALAATIGLSGCGNSEAPAASPNGVGAVLRVRIVGTGQQGFVGEALANPIGIWVDSGSHAVQGQRRIQILVADGGGSVSDTATFSDGTGHAFVQWVLGQAIGMQHLVVSLPDAPSSQADTASAQALPLDAADLVVVKGATSGRIGVLLHQDDRFVPYALTWPDTVLRLLPHTADGSWEEVTAFTVGHPPVSVLQPWTDGTDTVRLAFQAAIAVPITVWISKDFDTTAARARFDLNEVDGFWGSHMVGLRVGRTRIDSAPNLLFVCGGDTQGYVDASAINVYYMDYFGGPETCNAQIIRMSTNNSYAFVPGHGLVLAHELGHAMSLVHLADSGNVMWPNWPPGDGLRTGQIYWMHFHTWGAVNSILGIHPAAERNCNTAVTAPCPAQTLDVW